MSFANASIPMVFLAIRRKFLLAHNVTTSNRVEHFCVFEVLYDKACYNHIKACQIAQHQRMWSMAPQQEQQRGKPQVQIKRNKWLSQRKLIIVTTLTIALAIATTWILSSLNIIPNSWAAISSIIVAIFGAVFTFLQSLHLFLPPDTHAPVVPEQVLQPHSTQIPPIAVQLPTTYLLPLQSTSIDIVPHRGILSLPPATDPRTIQQREQVVREVYTKLIQPNIYAFALTGIGGIGKSTLAALIYRYVEEQRQTHTNPFLAETLWLRIDPSVTMIDIISNLCKALCIQQPDVSTLSPQNQAFALFNILNSVDKPRLVVLDQFENVLDDNGHAKADRPGIGEWLDALNSHPCTCRMLLTSRPNPQGTHEFPSTCLQTHLVEGLSEAEGIELLRKWNVNATEVDMRAALHRCKGHALSLALLASLLQKRNLSLATLLNEPQHAQLWKGNLAEKLLDDIHKELDDVQRKLLAGFSVYREPMPIEAATAIFDDNVSIESSRLDLAIDVLLVQHLLQAMREGQYQLHAIVADYARDHMIEGDEQANPKAVLVAHTRAAQYYLERTKASSHPREQRRQVGDVHDLIEAICQYCQAEKQQVAYDLMAKEGIYADLRRWGGNAILLELYELLLPLDRWCSNRLYEVEIYSNLGEVYRILGQMGPARKYLERGLSICKGIANQAKEAWILTKLGRVYYELGRKKEAEEFLKQALEIHGEEGDKEGKAKTLRYLGQVYDRLEQIELAQESYQESLRIYREIGDKRGEGWVLYTLGNLYNARMPSIQQKKQARKDCEKALQILKEVGDREKIAWAFTYLGRSYNALGKHKDAIDFYEEAIPIHREVGNRRGEGWTFYNLGKAFADLRGDEEALKYYEQALNIQREVGDRWNEGITLNQLGWLYLDLKNIELATKYYEQALSIRIEVDDQLGMGRTLKNLVGVYVTLWAAKKDNDYLKQAMDYLKQAIRINKEVGDSEGEARSFYTLGLLSLHKHRPELALTCFLHAKSIFEKGQSTLLIETRSYINKLHQEVGDEQYNALQALDEPQIQSIVEQMLNESWE